MCLAIESEILAALLQKSIQLFMKAFLDDYYQNSKVEFTAPIVFFKGH